MVRSAIIPIQLANGAVIEMVIYEELPGTLFVEDPQIASENGESPYQLKEGASYEYELPKDYRFEDSQIVKTSKIDSFRGRIRTNIYVGILRIDLYKKGEDYQPIGHVFLEVRSVKADYRTDYRRMLEDITNKCTDLLLRHSSSVYQTFTVDPNKDPQTLYQRFAFVASLIQSESFSDALYRIGVMPIKRWEIVERKCHICNVRRIDRSVMRQIMTSTNRISLPSGHSLKSKFEYLPNHVDVTDKKETTDVVENRFIKYVLETFLQFTLAVLRHPKASERLVRDAQVTIRLLEKYLSMPVFKEVARLDIIPLNSPVLQRKEGYREILQAYLMFDMAASLVWRGGEDVYYGGKRDVAILYEYWLFFQMLDLIEEVFGVKPHSIDNLIEPQTDNTLELTLKRGVLKMVDGVFEIYHRKFHLEFCYNRTFRRADAYPAAGSWTGDMRPDYTLSIWPESLTQDQAERQEMIVHLHFDAKYKIENFSTLLADRNLNDEKEEEAKGCFKRADLLKMHAYKDAIRRTAGAYILYPGRIDDVFSSFHEILPGIGAFSISPSNQNKVGLKQFLQDVVRHLANRTSQRSLFSYYAFRTFREKPGPEINGKLPIDECCEFPKMIHVLIGFYRDQQHLDWILKNRLYNVRTDHVRGSLKLSPETIAAKYLLLHTSKMSITNLIYCLDAGGPRVVSDKHLIKLDYPSKLTCPYYIGYTLQSSKSVNEEFGLTQWDIRKLSNYQSGFKAAYPFTVTLEELMGCKCDK